jgi:hypothetical protein
MERLQVTFGHLSGAEAGIRSHSVLTSEAAAKRFPDSENDVVIISARRTAIAKGNRGSFKVLYDTYICTPYPILIYEGNDH